MNAPRKVAVLGAGSWGTALASLLARNGFATTIWGRDATQIENINMHHENSRYLPGIALPENLKASTDLIATVTDADFILVVTPSHAFNETLLALAPYRKEFSFFTELEIELPSGHAVPDVCIYPKIAIDWRKDILRRIEAPILTIEILSPRQALDDINSKIDNIYFQDNVKAAWIILPRNQTVLVLTPDGKTRTYTEGVIRDETTGIELTFEDIFAV